MNNPDRKQISSVTIISPRVESYSVPKSKIIFKKRLTQKDQSIPRAP